MSRESDTPSVTVLAPDGRRASWSPQSGFTGDPGLVASAHELSQAGIAVPVTARQHVIASADSPAGALAALVGCSTASIEVTHLSEAARAELEIADHEGFCGNDGP